MMLVPNPARLLVLTNVIALLAAYNTPTADASHLRSAVSVTPALSPEAEAALPRAEVDVQAASDAFALWTTALEALKRAREAAVNGVSGTVLREASRASRHAMLGLQQKGYPFTELKRPGE